MKLLLAKKKGMSSFWGGDGCVYPVTILDYSTCRVIKGKGNSGSFIGIGYKRKANKPMKGIFGDGNVPELFVKLESDEAIDNDIYFAFLLDLKFGDRVSKVTSISKGKGFAGVVKRWRFAGGPKTRGQSDRWRHPGSIGSGTTVGRVLKGLKMGGRMGGETVTIRNLKVFSVDNDNKLICVVGSVPGTYDSIIRLYLDK